MNSQERVWIQPRFESEGFGTRDGQLKFVFPTVGKIILKYWLGLYVNDFLNTEHKDGLTPVVIIWFKALVNTVVNWLIIFSLTESFRSECFGIFCFL